MSILARFLVYFGGAFLGIGVIIMSFMRRRMINRGKQARRKRRLVDSIEEQKKRWASGKK
jgi:hypothetical protein